MENASKALLMAASILMGILILSLGVYLYMNFSATSKQINKQIEENQISQFNGQFLQYDGMIDRDTKTGNLTIYDVITIVNLATENNINYQLEKKATNKNESTMYVTVNLDRTSIELGYNSSSNNSETIQNYINTDLNYPESHGR